MAERIKYIQSHQYDRYGIDRIWAELQKDVGLRKPGHNQVARVMREYSLNAIIRRRKNYFSNVNSDQIDKNANFPNILNREFHAKELGTRLVSDVTYIPTTCGWYYLSVVLDLCNHEVITWRLSNSQNLELGFATLAGLKGKISPSCLLHTDRGNLYTCTAFRELAKELGIVQSYSRKGNCWDNSVMEGWNGILKTEWLYNRCCIPKKTILTPEKANEEIDQFIRYYNEERIQKNLGYLSPVQYREKVTHQDAH